MNLKNEYFEIGLTDVTSPEHLAISFTPEQAYRYKMMLEERIYEQKYKGEKEDHSPFIIAISGCVKPQHPDT
ncbi:MAG: hypothetical protein ACUZ8N_06845 [Candidatus Scalindua sp.]